MSRSPLQQAPSPSSPPSPRVGQAIEVFWARAKNYRGARVLDYSERSHLHTVEHFDGSSERIDLSTVRWRLPKAPSPLPAASAAVTRNASVPAAAAATRHKPSPAAATRTKRARTSSLPAAAASAPAPKRPRPNPDLQVLANVAAEELCAPVLQELADLRAKVDRSDHALSVLLAMIDSLGVNAAATSEQLVDRLVALEATLQCADAE